MSNAPESVVQSEPLASAYPEPSAAGQTGAFALASGSPSPVAVLGVAAKSIYKTLPGVECYDAKRDMRTFAGGMPVVAHPPCRSWSAYCAHQAKPLAGEKELGPLCVAWLRKCGGVLEHPAHSRLFDYCGLPKPGKSRGDLWTAEVLQAWWGDTRTKTTWLCFSRIAPNAVHFPFALHSPAGDRRRWQVMSHTQRSATHPAMAAWLVNTARLASVARTKPCSVCKGKGYEVFPGYSLREVCFACGGKIDPPDLANK